MKNYIPVVLLAISFTCLGLLSFLPKMATCTGSTPCKACKNCKYCKHCTKDGKTCGVCKK